MRPNTTSNAYESLGIANFRLFLLSRLLVVAALEMMLTIMGWQIYEATKDPLALGLIGLAEAVPFILVSLFSGYVIDSFNRHRIGAVCLLLTFLLGFALFWGNYKQLDWVVGHLSLFFYLIIFLMGLVRGFLSPSFTSLLPQLVERRLYANAVAWNSNTWQTAAVGGPALGGLIYGFGGVNWAYGTMLLFMALSFVLWVSIKYRHVSMQKQREPIMQSLREGARFVFNHQILLGALSLDMFAVLFGGAVALLPMFAADVLHVGPEGLGLLRAAPFAGSIVMGFYLAYYPPMHQSGYKLLLAVAGFGISIILFGLSTNFYWSLLLLFFSGIFDNVSVVIRSTILQLGTPDHIRGRVSAFNGIFLGVSNEIGAFESGLAARLLGLVPSVIFGGTMTLLVVALAYWRIPALRTLNLDKWTKEQV